VAFGGKGVRTTGQRTSPACSSASPRDCWLLAGGVTRPPADTLADRARTAVNAPLDPGSHPRGHAARVSPVRRRYAIQTALHPASCATTPPCARSPPKAGPLGRTLARFARRSGRTYPGFRMLAAAKASTPSPLKRYRPPHFCGQAPPMGYPMRDDVPRCRLKTGSHPGVRFLSAAKACGLPR
jgi:hypothetical protein